MQGWDHREAIVPPQVYVEYHDVRLKRERLLHGLVRRGRRADNGKAGTFCVDETGDAGSNARVVIHDQNTKRIAVLHD